MNKKGFTLTEILIVLVVAGILLALILPNTLKAIERGEVTQLRSDLNTVKVSLFMCFTQERDWANCDSLTELENLGFLDAQFNAQAHPFGVTYGTLQDPNPNAPTGGFVSCYNSTATVPADITNDTSLNQC